MIIMNVICRMYPYKYIQMIIHTYVHTYTNRWSYMSSVPFVKFLHTALLHLVEVFVAVSRIAFGPCIVARAICKLKNVWSRAEHFRKRIDDLSSPRRQSALCVHIYTRLHTHLHTYQFCCPYSLSSVTAWQTINSSPCTFLWGGYD